MICPGKALRTRPRPRGFYIHDILGLTVHKAIDHGKAVGRGPDREGPSTQSLVELSRFAAIDLARPPCTTLSAKFGYDRYGISKRIVEFIIPAALPRQGPQSGPGREECNPYGTDRAL